MALPMFLAIPAAAIAVMGGCGRIPPNDIPVHGGVSPCLGVPGCTVSNGVAVAVAQPPVPARSTLAATGIRWK